MKTGLNLMTSEKEAGTVRMPQEQPAQVRNGAGGENVFHGSEMGSGEYMARRLGRTLGDQGLNRRYQVCMHVGGGAECAHPQSCEMNLEKPSSSAILSASFLVQPRSPFVGVHLQV